MIPPTLADLFFSCDCLKTCLWTFPESDTNAHWLLICRRPLISCWAGLFAKIPHVKMYFNNSKIPRVKMYFYHCISSAHTSKCIPLSQTVKYHVSMRASYFRDHVTEKRCLFRGAAVGADAGPGGPLQRNCGPGERDRVDPPSDIRSEYGARQVLVLVNPFLSGFVQLQTWKKFTLQTVLRACTKTIA